MMARRTEAVHGRKQQAVVRGETDNTCTRIEAVEVEHSYSNNKKLRTVFQVSKISKQPTRKVALDVAVSNTSKCLAHDANAVNVKSKATISQCVDQSQIWQ